MTKARKAAPKSPLRAKPAQAATPSPAIADKVLLLLVSGMGQGAIAEAVVRLGLTEEQIPAALAAARRRLTIAADYHREREIGTAYTRLNDLYCSATALADTKTALAAQKELNRLLALYPQPSATGPAAPDRASEEIAAALGHLEPLALPGAKPGEGVAELCRLAVARLVELEGRNTEAPA